ncbi:MAG: ABC transporter substrate-binding protein [Candidatus Adiutrix sp.]|jgi:polar amino acid transport system substrate-binding protein|nr:ABC transporter substrate-binding protein [Candidatus Adiutrix sp.]
MFKKLPVLFALLMLLSVPALAQDKVFVNGIDANFPPFAYIGPDGKATGFDVDAMNWIAKEMGFKVEHKPMEWSGIVASLKARKIDMISSGLSKTEERATQIDFSAPYWTIKQVVVVAKDSTLTADQALKSGLRVGVQSGTSDAKTMADVNGQEGREYELVEYPSSALAAQDVLNGRIDAAVMNDAPAAAAAAKIDVKIVGEAGLPNEVFAIGVAKDDPETLKLVNEGLAKIMADPYWQELIEKYQPGQVQ